MRRSVTAAAALLVLITGGCGIPENSDVLVVGHGPISGTSVDGGGTPPMQGTRDSTPDPAQFVDYYLKAAAGDPESALTRVKAFMAPEFASGFKAADPDVKVIRLAEKPLYTPGVPEITLRAQTVGRLKSNGVLEPAENPDAGLTEYKLRVAEVAGKGLFITQAPPNLLLTDTGLNDFYQRRTIYFWNTEQTALVPDMRYMPRGFLVQQPTTILKWLANGPAGWLSDRVRALPSGTVAPDNVPAIANDTLQVTLNANAVPPNDDKARDLLRRQLQWSLRPLLPRVLELRIGHQDPVRYEGTDFLSSNLAYRPADAPERFVVYDGVVRRLVDSPRAAEPVPVLKAADNKGIAAAAMSAAGTQTFAAVVTAGANGRGQRLRVASSVGGEPTELTDVPGLSGTLGRPVWAVTEGDPRAAVGLITANGRLYSFRANGARARPVDWQGEPSAVAAVAVAPDERRVALVSAGKLYRSVLGVSDDAITLSSPEQLQAPTLRSVAAVAWSSEDWLVVAGVRGDGRVSIMDLTIDGALQDDRLPDIGDKMVSYLTAYPADPSTGREQTGLVSYTAGGSAWDALSAAFEIRATALVGVTGNQPARLTPTAPFFLD
jgi:lipoprotein LpqB-like beta-propeller protein